MLTGTEYATRKTTEQKAKRLETVRSQYRQVITLFPDSPAAQLARQRLASDPRPPDRAVPKDKDHTYPGSM